MRTLYLMSAFALLIIAATSCSTASSETGNSAAASSARPTGVASPPAASPTAPQQAAAPVSDLKPGDVSLDKPAPADELRNAVFGDEAAWMGKEVFVAGGYNGHSKSSLNSGDKYAINIQGEGNKVSVVCEGTNAPPEDVKTRRDGRVAKGTVKSANKGWQQVVLDPCELVK